MVAGMMHDHLIDNWVSMTSFNHNTWQALTIPNFRTACNWHLQHAVSQNNFRFYLGYTCILCIPLAMPMLTLDGHHTLFIQTGFQSTRQLVKAKHYKPIPCKPSYHIWTFCISYSSTLINFPSGDSNASSDKWLAGYPRYLLVISGGRR